ncbi:hypothetical protein SAY87_030614 [Trapa incisa]|uniref:Uncharacterized protein n=1 Tax=Trapa incisa TaxID=236973 RepID=A0AAN7KNI4_9MYRT|nr:hypothetical protein SAY87_030614 [Trapa incisa]
MDKTKSCTIAFPRARSEMMGYRRSGSVGGGRSMVEEDWTSRQEFWMTPPGGAVQSDERSGDGEAGKVTFEYVGWEKSPPFDGRLMRLGWAVKRVRSHCPFQHIYHFMCSSAIKINMN